MMAEKSFAGRLRVRHLPELEVTVTVADGMLEIAVGDETLGTWPLEVCAVAPGEPGTFEMTVEGEQAHFVPQDPTGFAAVAAARFRSASLADRRDVLRSSDGLPIEQEDSHPSPPQSSPPESSPARSEGREFTFEDLVARLRPYRYVAFVVSALVAGALAAALGLGPAGEPPPTLAGTGTSLPSPPASIAPAFSLTPRAFADRWNDVADELGVDLRLLGVAGDGSFEARPAEHILVQGEVGVDGTVDGVVLTADPTVGVEGRRLVVAAWGLLMAVADPSLEPEDRAAVLEELGVDVERPRLRGVEASVRSGGLRYSINYLEGLDSVLFSVDEP